MKTSILISSFAALCLLITFAETPRRHGEDKKIAAPTENIIFTSVNNFTMLSGPVISPERKNKTSIKILAVPAEDFSYLEFNVNQYLKADAAPTEEIEILPVSAEIDFRYMKFNVSDYTDSGLNGNEITDLPENEVSSTNPSENVKVVNEFNYLRFDVNTYINESGMECDGIGELPSEELQLIEKVQGIIDFNYLKFDVTKYYITENQGSEEQFELPGK